jgi:alkanesulfonate monooxygenase SsuD/methylene tetrahydromethanopterin reductase-like flavin-dependent oxidoreductase (luciferase family)
MKFAVDVPNHGEYSDPKLLLELAIDAENAGWDGFFIWDHILKVQGNRIPVADPWIALSAIAATTERLRIGPMVTPLARRRPWKVARETVTLDHLSGGRLIFGVGLGARSRAEFGVFGDEDDPKVRGEMLDEGLQVLDNLWKGEPFTYQGDYYHVSETTFTPQPVQTPRIPVWVAGTWPNKKPLRRAARWDGAFPLMMEQGFVDMMPVEQISQAAAFLRTCRGDDRPFDLVHLGISPGKDLDVDAQIVKPYRQAGVTWWLENINSTRGSLDEMRQRIITGPPKEKESRS